MTNAAHSAGAGAIPMLHHLYSKVRFARACPRWAARSAFLAVSIAALASGSCGGVVEVGEAKDDDTSNLPDDGASGGGAEGSDGGADAGTDPVPTAEPVPPPVPAPLDCTDADRLAREPYEAWPLLPNDFGGLSGKTFDGYVEGGPDLSLIIDDNDNATLVVGEPAPPPVADAGYLCGDALQSGRQCALSYEKPPVEGGVYPLRGARFAAGRLIVPIQRNAPYDAWCALQTPYGTDVCYFAPIGGAGFSMSSSTGVCSYDGRLVDCGWLELVQYGPCRCTSSECFADIHLDTAIQIDARFDETNGELSGSFINGDRAEYTIYLFEVVE